ncbi:MAG: winged helix-turn-helix domain-containing protein [Pseudomonadota bacterium]
MKDMEFAFDAFILNTGTGELLRDGASIQIEPQVFDLLHLLVSSNGRVVSREEIFEAIWGQRIVSEAALSSRIRDCRKALGDTGKEQRFIKTVKKRGLKFVSKVTANVGDPVQTALPDLSGKPSIVVIPFNAVGQSEAEGFIAHGLTEDITSNLARFRGLVVFSRTTVSAAGDSENPIADLHNRHGVDLALRGSLQHFGQRLRVRAELIDAATETILLSEQFDRPYTPESQFDIQDDIAALVAARVGDLYGPTGQLVDRLVPAGRPNSWETIVWLARFHRYTDLRDPADHHEVTRGLERAVRVDPKSADGWAALARMKIEEYRMPYHFPPKLSLREESLEYARKAVQLDNRNELALVSLALAHFQRYETQEFESAAARALDVNPNNAFTLAEIALCLCCRSEFDRAVPLAQRAIELSPVHPGWFRFPFALGLFMSGNTEAALEEELRTPVPGFFWYHTHLAAFYADLDMLDKASAEVETVREIYPQFEKRLHTEAFVHCIGEPFYEHMAKGWRKAGFDIPSDPYVSGYR